MKQRTVLWRAACIRLATTCCVLFWLLGQYGSCALAQVRDGNVLAEFEIQIDTHLIVPVTFEGETYNFYIDTGCGSSNFVPQLLPLLAKTDRERRFVTSTNTVTGPLYKAPEGRIGQLKLPLLDHVSCFDEHINRESPLKIHGCLGMDAMWNFIIRVDYGRRRIYFLRSVPRDAGVRVRLGESLGTPTIEATVGDRQRTFVIDTGWSLNDAGGISKRDFDELVARAEVTVVGQVQSLAAVGFREDRAAILNVSLSVAGYSHAGLAFSEIPNRDRSDNTLGAGYLRRYVVTFDFPRHAVYFAPGQFFRQIDASPNPGGVRLMRAGENVLVFGMAPRDKAWAAGIRPRDILVEINGRSTNGLDDIALATELSRSDRPTSMVFKRASDNGIIRFVHDDSVTRQNRDRQKGVPSPQMQPVRIKNGGNTP